jgi:hypothetical protein
MTSHWLSDESMNCPVKAFFSNSQESFVFSGEALYQPAAFGLRLTLKY